MAQSNDDIKWLYGKLRANGYNIGSEQEFTSSLSNQADRDWYYDKAKSMGLDMGSREDFEGLYAPAVVRQDAPADAIAEAPAPSMQAAQAQEQSVGQGWQPSEQDKIRTSYQMHTILNDFNQKSKARLEQMRRMGEQLTPEGRKKLKAKKFQAQLAGTPTRVMGLTTPVSVSAPDASADKEVGATQQPPVQSGQSPVPYGVKYVDGKPVTEWLMPDGSLTTNYADADKAEYGARTARMRHDFEQRMKRNGLDPDKPEDVQKQTEQDMISAILAPMEREGVAESLWRDAEKKHKADRDANAGRAWDSYAAMGGGREMRVMAASENRHADNVSRMSRFDLQNMMDSAWARVGGQMTDNCFNLLRKSNPEASEQELRQTASEWARQLCNKQIYDYAVKQNTPKSTLEYFGRTVADMNVIKSIGTAMARSSAGTSGDLAAYEQAMGEYGKDHRVAQVGGTVVGMGIDPITWVSGGVGSMAGKSALNLGGRFMASRVPGMSVQAGTRLFGNSLTGRIIVGSAGTAGNLGAYEGLKEAENQFKHGGYINPVTGENEGYSVGEMLKSTGHGAIMGSVIGPLSPVIGNVADKAVKATSSTAGKAALRGGEVAVSTLAEGTIFSVPQWMSGEGDAFDVWTDNMAMMLGFKAQHGLKSAPRVIAGLRPIKEPKTQAERNHNRMSFEERVNKALDEWHYTDEERRAGYKIEFTKDEREELRHAGYGELADLFKRSSDEPLAEARGTDKNGAIDYPRVEAETIYNGRPEFDGYSAMEELVQDGSVSESTRAKAYFVLTGRMLPMSTVVGHSKTISENGTVTVKSVNANGDVVTSRRFASEKQAQGEIDNIMRQAELNSVDVGERYAEANADDMVLSAAVNEVSPGADPEAVKRIYRAVKAGNKEMTAEQVQLAEFIDDAIARNKDIADVHRPETIREAIKEETGIDVDATLRKSPAKRSEAEKEAVKTYLERLFPEEERQRAEEPTPEQTEAQNQYEQGRLLYGRFEEGDPEAQTDVDAIALRMQEAYQGVEDAFGAESEYYMFHLNENPWDLLNAPELTVDQQDAVLNYVNAKAALDGVMDASNEAADRKLTEVENAVEKRTHKESGVIIPATMKVDDRQVYVVKGNVEMFPDGNGVDVRNSSEHIVVMDVRSGEYEFTSPDQILSISQAIDPQAELDAAQVTIEQEQMKIFGENAMVPQEDSVESLDSAEKDVTLQHGNGSEQNNNEQRSSDGSGMAADSAGSVEADRDRSDIRVYEEGLGAPYNEYSEYSERARRDQEAERLIGIAQREGHYRTHDEISALGKPHGKLSGESEVYVDEVEGKVFKVKNPYAKAPMKGNVQPEDAIYEHLVHNKYFPETRYQFEGISDDAGDVRIVLSQDYIGSVDKPTDEQIETALAERGLFPEGKYRYGNDEISVTDVTGDNVLLGEDGKVYFIDPIIDFRKPVREILSGGAEGVEANQGQEVPAGEHSVLSKIPVHPETNEPMFEAVDKETAWAGLVEAVGGEIDAADIATAQVKQASAELEALKKKPPTLKAPKLKGSPMAMAQAKREAAEKYQSELDQYNQQVADAQARLDAWNGIQGVYTSRNAELRRQREEAAETARIQQQREDEIRRMEVEESKANRPGLYAKAMSKWDDPLSAREYMLRDIAGGGVKFRWSDDTKSNIHGLGRHITSGDNLKKSWSGDTEFGSRRWMIDDKNGIFPEAYAERICQDFYNDYGQNTDHYAEVFGDLLDIVLAHPTSKSMYDEAHQIYSKYREDLLVDPETRERMKAYGVGTPDEADFVDVYGIRYWEYETDMDMADAYAEDMVLSDEEYSEINRKFAESQLESQENLNERSGQIGVNDARGIPEGMSGGSSLLQEEQSDVAGGTPGIAQEGGSAAYGDAHDSAHGASQEAPGREVGIAAGQELTSEGGELSARIKEAEGEVNTNPTDGQKEAGNYKKGHIRVDSFDITIEQPAGSVRRGKDASGKEWETEMHHTYGYIRGTHGVDGDHIDVFLSDTPEVGDVFVIDQYNPDGSFDEHKVMYGFADRKAALDAYLANYEQGWEQTRRLDVTGVGKDEFKKWIQSSKRKTKPFAKYKSVTQIEENGVVGRSLTESEATELIGKMENVAEVANNIELTPENWIAQFGEDGKVTTPIGEVKMGENQFMKLFSRKRAEYFGMIKPTLTNPDVVLEEINPKEGAERDSKYLFIKTFVKSDGSRIVHFESVTVRKDGMEVSISSHEIKDTAIKNKMQNDKILHLDKKLSPDSEVRLTETPIETEGPDLVPTSDNISSEKEIVKEGGLPFASSKDHAAANIHDNSLTDGKDSQNSLTDQKKGKDIVEDRRGRYGAGPRMRPLMTGATLFDWADREERSRRKEIIDTELGRAAAGANAELERFTELYDEYLQSSEAVGQEIKQLQQSGEDVTVLNERLADLEQSVVDARKELTETVRDYFALNNSPEDANRIARDMVARAMAEVEVRRNKVQILRDILESAPSSISEKEMTARDKVEVKTAGGRISYDAVGHLPDAQKGEFAYVERQFLQTGEFDFTGDRVIHSRGDIAYLFRALEDYGIEHVFGVLVKDGNAKVVHLGMGAPTMSVSYSGALRGAYDAFGADKVYLLHNHPSGNLRPSDADARLLRGVDDAFNEIGVETEGLIIDTTSGRYISFDSKMKYHEYSRPDNGGDVKPEVYNFGGVKRSGTDHGQIGNSKDVVKFISEQRFGNGEKVSYLILDNANHIIGNFHTGYDRIDSAEFAEEIASTSTKYGGVKIVVYGNVKLGDVKNLDKQVRQFSVGGVRLMDAMRVHDMVYDSAFDEGYISEAGGEYALSAGNGEESKTSRDKKVYVAAKGLVESAGIEVEEVSDAEASEMLNRQGSRVGALLDAERDEAYLKAVEAGDMEAAQRMVDEAAQIAGYSTDSSYQGTSAFNGAAPYNGYGWSKDERREYWESGDFEGDWTLGDHVDFMQASGDQLDFLLNHPNGYQSASATGRESISAIRQAIKRGDRKITVYRSVPSSVKEQHLRNGDWVTPSRKYAEENAALHGWGNEYRIIKETVDLDELWWDGNDINEWGYDKGDNMSYKNTANNRKLHDAVTYDDNGRVIPLSERFNEQKSDVRYLKDGAGRVYGWTVGGKVYLNRDAMSPATPVHEYTHLWDEMVKKENPELWHRGVELMKQTPVWQQVVDDPNYVDIRDDEDAIASEVHSRLTGKRGSRVLEDMIEDARKEGPLAVAERVTLVERIKRWLRDMFKSLKATLSEWSRRDLEELTEEDFVNMTLRDLAEGLNPNVEMRRGEVARSVIEANPMLDDYHRGVRSRKDVMTFDEVLKEAESAWAEYGDLTYPDMDIEMLRQAKESGTIMVYSSKPIETGTFVTPSRMNAEDYAGDGEVFSKEVGVDEVAWTGEDEGQYAPASDQADLWQQPKLSASSNENESGADDNAIERANRQFNQSLMRYIKGAMSKQEYLGVGNPEGVMKMFLSDAPIVIRQRVLNKASVTKHNIELSQLQDLPAKLAEPIFVFQRDDKTIGVLTEARDRDGKNVCVAIELKRTIQDGSAFLEVNDIRSLHGRDAANIVLPIAHNNTLKYVDKEKGLAWLSSASSNYQQEIAKLDLDSAAKIVKNFENPQISTDNLATNGDGNKYRIIEQKDLLDFLNNQPLKLGYRYSQWANMGVLPPMSAKQNGEWRAPMIFSHWEQSEEGMRKDNGKADLVQGNGRTTGDVAYNPYLHIRTSPLNDQFTAAYDRPELLVVEGYYPESEETSGYHAEGAKDSVGLMDWHSGSVNGQLSEETKVQTMLSRYFKPSRIVPWSEVADLIMERVGDQKITFPINVVPPMLRAELAKRGAKFSGISGSVAEADIPMLEDLRDRVNAGEWDAGLEKAREYMDAYESSPEAKEARVETLSANLHTPIRVIRDQSEIDTLPTRRERRAKGWWSSEDNGVVVVLPNNVNVADVDNTVVHEVVGHKGLRALIGEERFDDFLGEVYTHASDSIRKRIEQMAQKMVDAEVERLVQAQIKDRPIAQAGFFRAAYESAAQHEAEKKREQFTREATEEYMSDLGGRIGSEGFEKMSRDELTLWGKIKAKVQQFLDKFLQGLKIAKSIRLNDKDLSYILYKSWKNLRHPKTDFFAEAEDAVRRQGTRFSKPRDSELKKVRKEAVADRIEELFDQAISGELKGKPVEVGRLTVAGRKFLEQLSGKQMKEEISFVVNPSDLLHIHHRHFGNNEKDGRNIPLTKEDIRNIHEILCNPDNVIYGIEKDGQKRAMFFFLKEAKDGSYNLMEVYADKKGNLTSKSFFKSKEGVSQRAMLLNESAALTSVTDGATLVGDAKLPKFFEYPKLEGEEDVIRFRDPGLGLEETITKMKAEAMQANAGNLQAKRDAMKAIGGNLNHLRQAMARQREYDITTVKSVSDLARVLMEAGLLDDLSQYETKRILGAINNVVGRQDVSQYVQKVMDIMVDNQLRLGANTLGRLLSIRGSRVDARGIEVQGELDPDGQRIAQVVRKSASLPKDDIDNRIADAINRMSSTDNAIADEATIEYAGLQIARQYVEEITESKAEEKALRDSIKQAKEDKDAGQMTEAAYKQYVEATNDAICQNKIDRAEAFHSLVEQVGGILAESVNQAKAWRLEQKNKIEEIHHNANSDMEGRPTDEHHKDDRTQKILNNSFARFLLAPLATFDQMLRMFGKKNSRGEGYLWNRYMRGWVEAAEKEYTGYRDALKVLDNKVSEVFGKEMTWGDLFAMDRKLPNASVEFWDGGEMKDHELTQGNLLYIYMADKMSDGRMKLRRMGITEDNIENIKNFLDPRFIQLADWMQEEFLVDKRNEYNEVHKRMFGASMAAIENYFPLKILANARLENVDVADDTTDTALPATSTGSIIKRRRNNLALDVTGANAFSVILDHLQQMERWAAFAEFNRDLNTLLSYKRFRNQVMNMSSAYGAGKTLWNNFRSVCSMAAGAYRPPIAALDKSAVNIAKGVTAAKVSFRLFTALKQFLSMPAYLSDSNPKYLMANIVNPIGAWNWSMQNLPLYEKRWKSRMAGDPRLLKTDMDWKMWRSRVVDLASRVGMSPNAFVDALTVAIGAHSMYQTKFAKYKRQGYDQDVAEKRAKQDATILFNQTQQSSEGAFLSTMQVDRSWLSVLFTVFRNSSMSYSRQLYDAIRNISHRFTPGHKGLTEEFMAKQMMRDGIDPDQADRNAKQEYRRGIVRDIVRVGVFGYILQFAWNLGAYLPYLIFGDNEDEKDKMMDDVFNHSMFGSIEGLTGGDVMSAAGNMWVSGEGNPAYLTKDMPLASDVLSILKNMDKDQVAAMNDVINLCVQSGLGVNPQSLTDAVTAVMDFCGDDAETSRECALLIARVLNCPQSQIDKIYFDELDASARDASNMAPSEIAERYARYKVRRGAPLTGWAYGNEQREELMEKYRKRATTIAKDRITQITDKTVSPKMSDILVEYEQTKERVSEIDKVRTQDLGRYYELRDELEATPEFDRYLIVKRYKREVDATTKEWVKATTAAERDSCAQAIISLKQKMVNELQQAQ